MLFLAMLCERLGLGWLAVVDGAVPGEVSAYPMVASPPSLRGMRRDEGGFFCNRPSSEMCA
jgi:hypothetical protein